MGILPASLICSVLFRITAKGMKSIYLGSYWKFSLLAVIISVVFSSTFLSVPVYSQPLNLYRGAYVQAVQHIPFSYEASRCNSSYVVVNRSTGSSGGGGCRDVQLLHSVDSKGLSVGLRAGYQFGIERVVNFDAILDIVPVISEDAGFFYAGIGFGFGFVDHFGVNVSWGRYLSQNSLPTRFSVENGRVSYTRIEAIEGPGTNLDVYASLPMRLLNPERENMDIVLLYSMQFVKRHLRQSMGIGFTYKFKRVKRPLI